MSTTWIARLTTATCLAVAFASASACGSSQRPATTTAAVEEGAAEGSSGASPRHPAPGEALASCREALRGVQVASPELVNTLLIEGCRDLYAEQGCRDALAASLHADPEARARVISLGCRDAYCPHLAEPRPRICSLQIGSADPLTLAEAWQELTAAARRLDFGPAGAIPPASDPFAGLLIPIETTLPPVEEPSVVVRATLRPSSSGVELVFRLPDESETTHALPASPSADELGALLSALPVDPAETELVIASGPGTSFDAVQALLDAATDLGYDSFTLQAP